MSISLLRKNTMVSGNECLWQYFSCSIDLGCNCLKSQEPTSTLMMSKSWEKKFSKYGQDQTCSWWRQWRERKSLECPGGIELQDEGGPKKKPGENFFLLGGGGGGGAFFYEMFGSKNLAWKPLNWFLIWKAFAKLLIDNFPMFLFHCQSFRQMWHFQFYSCSIPVHRQCSLSRIWERAKLIVDYMHHKQKVSTITAILDQILGSSICIYRFLEWSFRLLIENSTFR